MTDRNVDPLFGDLLAKQLERRAAGRMVVEPGEESKSWRVAGRLLEEMAALQLRRHDLLVTLGGGVISDLGGFVASTYLRGIRVAHMPTTLLGQVDAAIGGKTGVNLSAGKNLAGTFYQPSFVIADVETLLTLPQAEFRSGLAEVIKYGLCFDPAILALFGEEAGSGRAGAQPPLPVAGAPTDLTDPAVLEALVYRCASIKARVVSEDETDRSGRMVLNYGHTLGHALEAAGGYRKWSHGEAISIGMVFAASLARQLGMVGDDVVEAHRRIFERAGLPVSAPFDPDEVARLWEMDKKRNVSQRWILLEGLGKPVVRADVGPREIARALEAVLV